MKRNIERLTFFVLGAVFIVIGYLIGEFNPKVNAEDKIHSKNEHITCKSITVSGGSLILLPESGLGSASIQVGFGKDDKPYFKFRDAGRNYKYADIDKNGWQIGKRDAGIEMGIDEDDIPYFNVFNERRELKQWQYVEIKAGMLSGARLRAVSRTNPHNSVAVI